MELLADENWVCRYAAARGLSMLRAPTTALRPLMARLGDHSPHVRRYAALALGRLGRKEALPALRERRDDESPVVQTTVRLAIMRLEAQE